MDMSNSIRLCLVAAALTAAAAHAQNTGAILTAGDDEFSYGAFSSSGVSTSVTTLATNPSVGSIPNMNFNVGDALNPAPRIAQLSRGNWHYRVAGDTRERQAANMTLRTVTGTTVEYEFTAENQFGAINGLVGVMGFQLTDTGPNSSLLTTYLCFRNNSGQSQSIAKFFFTDPNLNGTASGDVGFPTVTSGGRTLRYVDGGTTAVLYAPGAIGSAYGPSAIVLSTVTNLTVNNWNPDVSPGGISGGTDNGWGVQLRQDVADGQFGPCSPVYLGIGINGQDPVVPEPSSLLATALGAIVLMRRLRRPRAE